MERNGGTVLETVEVGVGAGGSELQATENRFN